MVDRLADSINKIKTNERIGRRECIVYSTKLTKAILEIMKKNEYIKDFEEFQEGPAKYLKIQLANKINAIGVIKPRYAISKEEIENYLKKEFNVKTAE